MRDFEEIDALEAQYRGPSGKPTLGRSYELLNERWQNGARDRETALRLLFLAWYSCSEPAHLTGLGAANPAPQLITDLFTNVGGEDAANEEVWFVVSIMAEVAPWCLGDEKYWQEVGQRFRSRLRERDVRVRPALFDRRGAYGDYFAHQARVHAQSGAA